MTKKRGNMFPSTAQKARSKALHTHQAEVDAILPLIDAASEKGDFYIDVPKLHDAVKEILITEHELHVKLVADYTKNPATLNHRISW